jgi:excisionase family DNA binding protein
MPPVSLITVQQAAASLKLSRSRVQALIASGRLPAEKVGMQYLIKPADLDKVKDRKPGRPRTARKPSKPRKGSSLPWTGSDRRG